MRQTPAGRREVLPRYVVEDDHEILRIKSLPRQPLDDSRQNLFLELHAATHSKEDLDQHEILCARALDVGEGRMKAEVLFRQLQDTVKEVIRMGADVDERALDGVEQLRLELGRLRGLDGQCDDGHDDD